ncbi:MAG: TraB/GumN family protein [Chitinophagaceae bacterium]|nr:TraB/GumN family protein [Chitinophagaceae bacterium]
MYQCYPSTGNAQGSADNALLWEISGNGLAKPSYLYGTVHMICKKDFLMSEALKKSFAATDKLYLEIDMDDPSMNMKMLQLSMLQGKKLSDFFNKEDYEKLNVFFRDSIGMPLTMFNTMKPFVLFSIISLKTLNCPEQESYEMSFVKMAKEQSKEILGLETVEEQMKIFDDMPDSVQAQMLIRYANEFYEQKEEFSKMIDLYKAQDLTSLYNQTISSPDIAGSEDVLLFNRNQKWIPVIENAMKESRLFVAVGAGHLAGDKGVINLLRTKGYTVKAVK